MSNLFITDILSDGVESKIKTIGDMTISELYAFCQKFTSSSKAHQENCEFCQIRPFCDLMDSIDETEKRFLSTPETEVVLASMFNEAVESNIEEIGDFLDKLDALLVLGYKWISRGKNSGIVAWKVCPAWDERIEDFCKPDTNFLRLDDFMNFMTIQEGENEWLHKREKFNIESLIKSLNEAVDLE